MKLKSLMEREGWTQADAAMHLGVSQGHLSKVLADKNPAGPKLRRGMAALLNETVSAPDELDQWLVGVRNAAAHSAEFRRLVEAAMQIMHYRN